MPQGYYVDGQLTYRPVVSVTTEFADRSGLSPATKALAVIGEFPFLEPYVPYGFTSQGAFLGAAPNNTQLRELANIIYSPSLQAPFNASPALVFLVNARPSTQAFAIAQGADLLDTVKLTSAVWGASGNLAAVTVTPRVPLGGYDVVVSSNGHTDSFVIDAFDDVLSFSYAHPNNGDVMLAPKTARGFDDTIDGTGTLTASKAAGASDITTVFARTITSDTAGADDTHVSWIPDGPVRGPLTITVPGGDLLTTGPELKFKVTGFNELGVATSETVSFTKAEVEGVGPVSGVTTTSWSAITKVSAYSDDGAGDWTGDVTLVGFGVSVGPTYGQTSVADAISYLNQLKGFTADTSAFNPTAVPIAQLDPNVGDVLPASFDANRWAFVTGFNSNATYVTAEYVGDYQAPPDFSSEVVLTLGGGTQTAADTNSWSSAIDALKVAPATVVFPYTTDSAIQVLCQAHVSFMWGKGQRERQLVVVPPVNSTFTTIKTLRKQMDFKSTVLADAVRVVQWDGSTSEYSATYWGLMFAALQCATVEIGQPLGGAKPRVVAFTRHPTLAGNDGAEELLRNSITPLDDTGDGIHVVRWVTAHSQNNDPTRTEGSAVESLAFSNISVREAVKPYLNTKALPGMVGSIKATIEATLAAQAASYRIRTWFPKTLIVEERPTAFVARYDVAPILPTNNIAITSNAVAFPRS